MNGNRGGEESVAGLKKGPWTALEDAVLLEHVKKHGEGNWNAVQRNTGLSRCGKSCRLRWANHLRPNLKKGAFTPEEERLILELHAKLGNKWARMAAQLPGRTDNEIKNYWNTRIKRRQRQGLPLYPPDIQPQAAAQMNLTTMNSSSSSMSAVNHGFPFLDTNGSFPEPSLFTPGHQHHQHYQPAYMFDGFQAHPFSSHPPPVPLLHQCLQQQQHQQFRPAPAISAVVELPSSQFSQLPCQSFADKAPWSLMPETHVVVPHGGSIEALFNHHENGKQDEVLHLGSVQSETFNLWDGSPASSIVETITNKVVVKEEPGKLQAVQEDLSSLLGMFPAPDPVVPQWYSGNGEATSGQTAGMAADVDIGVDMKQLATSLSATSPTASAAVAAAAEHHQGWTLSSCSWNNMPGIC